jgi:pimeloyl-ACP methyl ester carboxylesterase
VNRLIDIATHIPVGPQLQTISVDPVELSVSGRGRPIQMRITAPACGSHLPVVLLSHGGGDALYLPSKDGYAPLVNFLAGHGFVVIQPTHLSSKIGGRGLDPEADGYPIFWRSRVEDMKHILDHLPNLERQIPVLSDRVDRERIAIIGHSGGSHTAAMLLGAQIHSAEGVVVAYEPRVKAGVLMAGLGEGGSSLTPGLLERYPELNLFYSKMATRTLIVYGDQDIDARLSTRGADWRRDPYNAGPAPKSVLTLTGARHSLGGITGYDAKESDDEDPERLALTMRMTWAFLRSALYNEDGTWQDACEAFRTWASAYGSVESK